MVDYKNPLASLRVLALKLGSAPNAVVPFEQETPKPRPPTRQANVDWGKINAVATKPVVVSAPVVSELPTVSEELTDLTSLALKQAREILEMKLDPDEENFGVVLRGKVSMIDRILTTQTKVDENSLKARSDNKLGSLLDRLLEADRRINPELPSLVPDQ